MTIELTPNSVACNLACTYCYQNQMRDAGNVSSGYDFEKMRAGLEKEGGAFTVFGGEALLTPLPVLEEIFAYGLKKFGQNGVQTNGALITDAHVKLFKKYKVHVGFSLDGPGELNNSRWAGTLEKTRAATAASFDALDKVIAAGMKPSVIVTLYKGNATSLNLPALMGWFLKLQSRGVTAIRLHMLEVENEDIRHEMALSTDENIDAFMRLYEFQAKTKVRFDIFDEMARLLLGDDRNTTCIWNACDPYTTAAVRGVNGQGEQSNCGRTNKEGVDWQKAATPGYERQVALYNTPQSDLGCKDCRFFFACKGQCPGTAEHGDWRNRSEHCEIWMALFERIESDLVTLGKKPLSLDMLRPKVEQLMLNHWQSGRNVSIAAALKAAREGGEAVPYGETNDHGDHWDAPDGYQHDDNYFTVHGDNGMTKTHGDHNDAGDGEALTPLFSHDCGVENS